MEQIMSGLLQDSEVMTALKDKYIISLPNSGYPERIRNHITFAKHPEYFVDKLDELVNKGADIVGGCCGTGNGSRKKYNRNEENGHDAFKGDDPE